MCNIPTTNIVNKLSLRNCTTPWTQVETVIDCLIINGYQIDTIEC